jgi:hypothetical protein
VLPTHHKGVLGEVVRVATVGPVPPTVSNVMIR